MLVPCVEWETEVSRQLASDSFSSWKVHCFEEVDSTMDVARDLVRAAEKEAPLLVMAKHQTQGRGRQGRTWEASSGSLYMTAVLFSARPISSLVGLSLVVGLVIAQVCRELGVKVQLKWPNDVLSQDGRKLAGVLIELVPQEKKAAVLVGIGLNMSSVPEALKDRAWALSELTSLKLQPTELAAKLCKELELQWQIFEKKGFAEFRERWLTHAAYLKESVQIATGVEHVNGELQGISETGGLLLRCAEGVREFVSGDVLSLRKEV